MLMNACVTCILVTLTSAPGSTGHSAPEMARRPIRVQPGDDLMAAIEAAPPGATLLVSPGEYRGGVIENDAVTIRADRPAPDDRHTGLVQTPVRLTGSIDLRADSVTLDGLLWRDLDGQVLEIRGRRNTIRNCTFIRFGKTGPAKAIWIRETGDHADNVIEDCLFEDWGGRTWHSSAIKISQQGFPDAFTGTIVRRNVIRHFAVGGNNPAIQPFAPSLIADNVIHDGEDGIEVKGSRMRVLRNTVYDMYGGEAMSNRSGSDNLFEGNTLYNVRQYAWQIWSGRRNVWRNNVVYHCGRIAHIKGGDGPNAPAEDVLLINNTFFENDRGITWDLKRSPPRDIRLWNNIFVGDGSSAIESATLAEADKGLYADDYNLFYRFTPPRKPGRHTIVDQDPQFVSADERDFRLKPGSPARDAGAREVRTDSSRRDMAPEIDKDGAPRPMGDAPDLGAFESAAPKRAGSAQ
jgi:hypothetical protein